VRDRGEDAMRVLHRKGPGDVSRWNTVAKLERRLWERLSGPQAAAHERRKLLILVNDSRRVRAS